MNQPRVILYIKNNIESIGGRGDADGNGGPDYADGGAAGKIDIITTDPTKTITLQGDVLALGGELADNNGVDSSNGAGGNITLDGKVILNDTTDSLTTIDTTVDFNGDPRGTIVAGDVVFKNTVDGTTPLNDNLTILANDITFLADVGLAARLGVLNLGSGGATGIPVSGNIDFALRNGDSSINTRYDLYISSLNVLSSGNFTSGNIITKGLVPADETAGNNGGNVSVFSNNIDVGIVDTSGSDAVSSLNATFNGGNAGSIYFNADTTSSSAITLNGDIRANGGAATGSGFIGLANSIFLDTYIVNTIGNRTISALGRSDLSSIYGNIDIYLATGLFINDLNLGGDLTIESGNDAYIDFSTDVDYNGVGTTVTLTLNAGDHIYIDGDIVDSDTTDANDRINVSLNSDKDGDGIGDVSVGTSTNAASLNINTGGGYFNVDAVNYFGASDSNTKNTINTINAFDNTIFGTSTIIASKEVELGEMIVGGILNVTAGTGITQGTIVNGIVLTKDTLTTKALASFKVLGGSAINDIVLDNDNVFEGNIDLETNTSLIDLGAYQSDISIKNTFVNTFINNVDVYGNLTVNANENLTLLGSINTYNNDLAASNRTTSVNLNFGQDNTGATFTATGSTFTASTSGTNNVTNVTIAGGTGSDTFNFNDSSSSITTLFSGINTLTFNGDDSADTFNFNTSTGTGSLTNFDNINTINFNGDNGADIFNIGHATEATNLVNFISVTTLGFNGLADVDTYNIYRDIAGNLNGGAGDDIFNIKTAGLAILSIDGGELNEFTGDVINAANDNNFWLIEGVDDGRIYDADPGNTSFPSIQKVNFTDVENLNGGSSVDTFIFTSIDPSLTGVTVDGMGSSANIVRLADDLSKVTLVAGSFTNIERYVGNASLTNTLQGASGSGTTNTWSIEDFGVDSNGINDGIITTGVNTTEFINFALLKGGAGGSTDNFTFVGSASLTGTPGIDGNGGTNSIIGPDTTTGNTWLITDTNAGSINGNTFVDIQILTGSDPFADSFTFSSNSSLSGITLSGGTELSGPVIVDSVILGSEVTGATIVAGSFTEIENYQGNTNPNTLQGTSGSGTINNWLINGANSGTVNGFTFTNFSNLLGGASNSTDNFTFDIAGTISNIDGNEGTNSIIGPDTTTGNTWLITDTNAGSINGNTFVDIQILTGSDPFADSFTFSSNSSLSGITLSGGTELSGPVIVDSVILGSEVTGATIVAGSFTEIENYQGNTNSNTLQGTSDSGTINNWLINGANSGTVNGFTFTNFSNLLGGASNSTDNFTFDIAGSISNIDGNGGTDTITGTNTIIGSTWLVTGLNSGSLNTSSFTDIDILNGSSFVDTFSITGNFAGTINGLGGNDIFNINANVTGILDGGANNDTFNIFSEFTASVTGGANNDTFKIQNINLVLNQTLNGGDGTDTFIVANEQNYWLVDGLDSGTVFSDSNQNTQRSKFTNVENITGGTSADTFDLSNLNARISGLINGGSTSGALTYNTIIAHDEENNWNIINLDRGTIEDNITNTQYANFSLIQNLTGSLSANDSFIFTNSGNVNGLIDGRGATTGDQLDVSALGSVSVEVGDLRNSNININNIENVKANSTTNNTLFARVGVNTWSIENTGSGVFVSNGIDDGRLNGNVNFFNFRNLTGTNNAIDDFTIVDGASITGTINGGSITGPADYNTLSGQNVASDWAITNLDRGFVSYAGTSNRYVNTFMNIQTLNGGSNADQFTLSSISSAVTDEINGGITDLSDTTTFNTLVGFDQTNDWTLTAANQGDINTSSRFINVQNLKGALNADDTFTFNVASSLTGLIDGRGNTATGDSIDLSALQNNITIVADEDFINIEKIDARNGLVNNLVGTTGTNIWSINSLDAGTLNTSLSFLGFANLSGNDSDAVPSVDDFTFAVNGQLSGFIDGAGGASDKLDVVALNAVDVFISNINLNLDNDYVFVVNVETIDASPNNSFEKRINGAHVNNTWIIDGVDTGTISITGNNAADEKTRFNNFNNILGGYRDDRFQITGNISGTIDANESNDTTHDNDQIDFSLQTAERTISLADGSPFGSVINVEGIIGNGINMTLEGNNITNTWDITGINSGILNDGTPERITFSGFNYLRGNDQVDTFNVTFNPLDQTENGTIGTINGNVIEGEIFGAGGDDILNITLTGRESGQIRFEGGGQNDQVNISSGTLISGSYAGNYTPNVNYTFNGATNSYDQISYTHTSLKNFAVDYRNVNSVQDAVEADSFTINGTVGTDSIELTANSFRVNTSLMVGFSYADKRNLFVDALSASANNINISDNIGSNLINITFANAAVTSGTNLVTAGSLSFDNASAGVSDAQRMLTNIASLNISNSQAIYISDSSANLVLSQLSTAGIVDIFLASGNITKSASNLVSSADFIVNAANGDINFAGSNQLSGPVTLLAADVIIFENSIDTVIANVTTTDFTLNIFNSSNTSQAAGGIITANSINLNSGGDFNLGNNNVLNNITVSNANNVTIKNVNLSNIINVQAVANVDLASNGVTLGTVTADSIILDAGKGAITDVNGTKVNLKANSISLLATNGIGSLTNEIETEVTGTTEPGEISAVNKNGGDIALINTGNVLLRNVSNLDNDGNINIFNNGDLTIDSIETIADFTDTGTGRIDFTVRNGNIKGSIKADYRNQSDVRAESVSFVMDGIHSIGSGERPLSVEAPNTVQVLGANQTFIFFYGTEPITFEGENEFSNQIFDLINNLAGQQLIEVESLAQIDPAIFTDVRNYSHSDNALMMPVDQRYDDTEEEKQKNTQIN